MSSEPPQVSAEPGAAIRPNRLRSRMVATGILLLTYLLAAYFVLPLLWRATSKRRQELFDGPRITRTASDIPGDPVNVALVGSQPELIRGMTSGGWFPADPITLRSSLMIAVDSVFDRPDDDAPVSDLFLFGRKQDLAFEQLIGDSPRRRHHVRFWHWERPSDGREVWFGAATLDERVGLSYTTGQITHHIGPDVDAERDRILKELQQTGQVQEVLYLKGFHHELEGRNGGGDRWHTDGALGVGVLVVRTNQAGAAKSVISNQ